MKKRAAERRGIEKAKKRKQRARKRRRFLREIREWVLALLFALAAVVLIQTFLFTFAQVDGKSMNPTLESGERVFVTVADTWFGRPQRGDIVICHFPNRGTFLKPERFVKRVVGVPGDSVWRTAGVTYVNGEALDPDGLAYEADYDYEPYTLDVNEYFCVGDNRYNSHDSRDWKDGDPSRDVGPIHRSMIDGIARQVIWPLAAIRPLDQ